MKAPPKKNKLRLSQHFIAKCMTHIEFVVHLRQGVFSPVFVEWQLLLSIQRFTVVILINTVLWNPQKPLISTGKNCATFTHREVLSGMSSSCLLTSLCSINSLQSVKDNILQL